MPLCSVPGCYVPGVHLFPKDTTLKQKWEKAIRRKNFVATKHSRLCRNHFHKSDYIGVSIYTGIPHASRHLKKGTVPSIFPWSKPISTSPTPRSRRYLKKTKQRIDLIQPTVEESVPEPPTSSEIKIEIMPLELIEDKKSEDIIPKKVSVSTQCDTCLIEDKKSVDIIPKKVSVSTQCFTFLGVMSLETMKRNQQAINFYTGLENYEKFMLVLDTLSPMCHDLNYKGSKVMNVSVGDQLLITLIKLRRGSPDIELAFLFGISQTTVSNIFTTWINFMYEIWNLIDIWPSKQLVQHYMPESFQRGFASTRIIVDTTEIPITKPGNPVEQQATLSSHKHKNTLKAMIGATPGGLISYVSDCYEGSVSDRQIIESSNLIDLCDDGDSIMADHGFNFQDIFAPKGIKINNPMFLKGKSSKQFHKEPIIQLAKTYKILICDQSPYRIPLGSRILFVCAMLCNFRENTNK